MNSQHNVFRTLAAVILVQIAVLAAGCTPANLASLEDFISDIPSSIPASSQAPTDNTATPADPSLDNSPVFVPFEQITNGEMLTNTVALIAASAITSSLDLADSYAILPGNQIPQDQYSNVWVTVGEDARNLPTNIALYITPTRPLSITAPIFIRPQNLISGTNSAVFDLFDPYDTLGTDDTNPLQLDSWCGPESACEDIFCNVCVGCEGISCILCVYCPSR